MPLPCRNFKQGHSNLGQFLNVSFSLWVGSAVESEYLYVLAFLIKSSHQDQQRIQFRTDSVSGFIRSHIECTV